MNIKEIKEQFIKVVEYSQSFTGANVDELFDNWLEAKREIIEMFGGEPIVEIPLTEPLQLSDAEKDKKIESFLSFIHYNVNNYDLEEFCSKNRQGFFDNTVVSDYMYKGKKIPKGMKMTRAFKFFEPSPIRVDNIQVTASQYIQENRLVGTLCLSVHPLDFLSVSETSYNWHSCHALDGEYRAGNLSYMGDKSTVIAYIKGADNAKLPNFPEDVLWNSKKWRMLIYLSDSWYLMVSSRHYPFTCANAAERSREELLKRLQPNIQQYYSKWVDPVVDYVTDSYNNEYHPRGRYIYLRGQIVPLIDVVLDNQQEPLYYNDVLRGSIARPHYSAYYNTPWQSYLNEGDKVHIGSKCNCLRCNEVELDNPESFLCYDCEIQYGTFDTEIYFICSCCNRRSYHDDGYYVGDDEVCYDCFNNECFVCEECQDNYYLCDEHYVEELGYSMCPDCYDNYLREKEKEVNGEGNNCKTDCY